MKEAGVELKREPETTKRSRWNPKLPRNCACGHLASRRRIPRGYCLARLVGAEGAGKERVRRWGVRHRAQPMGHEQADSQIEVENRIVPT